jgi:hypothetical protein
MGLVTTTHVVDDKDLTTTADLDSPDSPLPDGWLKVQGYATIQGQDAIPLVGYFSPASVSLYGTKELVKTAADVSMGLS